MADTSFPQQKRYQTLSLITILFFISLLLIFIFLLSTENTLNLILSPSLYRDLFSKSSFKDPNFGYNHSQQQQQQQTPISQNLGNFGNISHFQPKDSDLSDNHSQQETPISQNLGNFGNVSLFQPKDLKFSDNVHHIAPSIEESPIVDNGIRYKDPNFNHAQELPTSEKREKDTRIVANEEKKDLGFVDGSVGDKGSVEKHEKVQENVMKGCNLFMGKWVRDDGYPLYNPGSCPYVDEAFDCQSNGRPDFEYLKWRWKPDECDLPRFNATDFLIRLRGKKLMLVGDSMNRNQFESMLCLLRQGLHDKSKMYEVHGYRITKGRGFYIFKFVDYNCTIEFVRSHFLVKEGTRVNGQGNSNPTLSIDKIDKTSGKWKRADILVFNTAHWWTHGKTSRGKNYYKEGEHIYPRFDAVEAYRRALKTWADWIEKNLNPVRQMVFYRAYSAAHFRGGDWDSGGTCNGEKEPILSGAFLDSYPVKMKIVEEAIQQMKVPVVLLNVTRLTNFRKDGHPSIYGKVRTKGMKVSGRKQDCSHWCLPGIPDAWNELIYATLVFQQDAISRVH